MMQWLNRRRSNFDAVDIWLAQAQRGL